MFRSLLVWNLSELTVFSVCSHYGHLVLTLHGYTLHVAVDVKKKKNNPVRPCGTD